MKIQTTCSALLLSALMALAGAAHAQTLDGQTPAQERVCDPLKADGITKGLYGLCVAFCEAHDAADISQAISEGDLTALLASRPNGRILANYNKKKAASDPGMPCVKVAEPCPCWDTAQLDILLTRNGGSSYNYDYCYDDTTGQYGYEYTYLQEWGADPFYGEYAVAYDFTASPYYQAYYGDFACTRYDFASGEYAFLDHLSPSVGASCRAQLQDRYAAAGIVSCNGYQ